MTSFLFELRYAWRSIVARPGFSALAVLVLAAGLASALSIASFMNTLVLNPLPFSNAEALYRAGLIDDGDAPDTKRFDGLNVNEVLDWQEYLEPVAEFGVYAAGTINLSSDERAERYSGGTFSAGLLPALGVQPAIGRNFLPSEQASDAPLVALISDSLWRQKFGADPTIIGRQIRINAEPAEVIGVMPENFSFPMREQLWLPAKISRGIANRGVNGGGCCFETVIRPKPGITADQVKQSLDRWLADALARDPEGMPKRAQAVGFDQLKYVFADRETIELFAVMGAVVLLVLLIACANVANLLLSSLLARERELALRMALGAGRGRLLLGLLLHSGLLSLFALLIALPLAQFGVDATVSDMRNTADVGPPLWMHFGLDARLALIAAATALMTAIVSGVLPALHAATRRDLSLRSQSQGAGGFARVSQWLMVAQVGFSLAVLMTTMLLVQVVRTLDDFDLGLDTDKVLTVRIGLFPQRFEGEGEVQRYVDRLLRDVRAESDVESAAVSSSLPGLMGDNIDALEQGVAAPATGTPNLGYSAIDPQFFSAMRATLLSGRMLSEADDVDSERVAVVDQTFVDRYLAGREPIGRQWVLDPGGDAERTITIVGVVRPIQMDDIDDAREAAVFVPFVQSPARFFSLFVRTRGEPLAFAGRLNAISQGLDADTPMYWVREYADVLNEATIGQRLLARMFTSFGVIALLLAATGLYGVVAFNVGRRTREIGIRRALGAPSARVLHALLLRTGAQVAIGLLLGLLIGIPFAILLSGQLGTVGEGNADVGVGVWLPALLLLTSAAALASWLPALRALRVEPNTALRYD